MTTTSRPSRRRVLGWGAAGLLGAGALAACSDSPPAPPSGAPAAAPPTTSTTPRPAYVGDQRGVALCAALSGLAASLYAGAVLAANEGRVGQVPAVVTSFLSGAGAQHTEHAAAWNALLTAAGRPAVTGTPLTVETERRATLGRATAPTDLLSFAVDVEASVGATVLARAGEFTDAGAAALAATVAPVAAMHGATVAFLLGRPTGIAPSPAGAALGPDALIA
ncbi:ferritin-like domain-containing protein [Actinomycetospora sp. TBRC 11914]|uniref:ferritin-like domain-containing protein n=1 Tax=Actinomycetospora sp. TBRC 11914 TaxID=2729387 RepID=UPI00145E49FF|nr:ferritin-like domain-containing protein [Actinomycetospora sp. TBRC 11914]NMO91854.1 ferritin-like domain-containing protein [Actinomycetospora sp. TBRC 11914]